MVDVLAFDNALANTDGSKRHLLLGNGFSIAAFPDRFRYGSLLEEADFSRLAEARQAFNALGTTDFEVVLHALHQAGLLLPLYGVGADTGQVMAAQAEALKELLVQALSGRHPERPSDVTEDQYRSCRRFLAHSAGESRNRGAGQNLRGNIYTVNYDPLLYWALLHDIRDWPRVPQLILFGATLQKLA